MSGGRLAMVCVVALLAVGCATAARPAAPRQSVSMRLQRLEDAEQIRALLNEYGRLLDRRDFAGFAALFAAADGEWIGGFGRAQGPAAIRAMMEAYIGPRPADQPERRQHFFANQSVRVDGDSATATSSWAFVVAGQNGGPQLLYTGHYEDTLVREGGAWKFRQRHVFADFAAPPAGR
jgi:uncharacterized protein (TIGR02246 family)